MKKVVTSIIMAIMLISIGIGAYAAETQSTSTTSATKKALIEIKLFSAEDANTESKEVKLKLSYGSIENLSDDSLVSFKGILNYDPSIFEKVDVKGLNNYEATYSSETKRIVVDPKKATANTDIAEITLTMKEEVESTTTAITFNIEELVEGQNDLDISELTTNVKIEKAQNTSSTTTSTNTTDSTNTTTSTTTQATNSTTTTTDTNQKGELEILTTNTTTKSTQSSIKSTQDTTKTNEKELPKTGLQTVALVLIIATAIGTLSYFRYKNIEIK